MAKPYEVRVSDYANVQNWQWELLKKRPKDLRAFYVDFQMCFGRSAAVTLDKVTGRIADDNSGWYGSLPKMKEHFASVEVTYGLSTLESYMAALVADGILSKARIDPSKPARGSVYLLNTHEPHQYDELAVNIAAKLRNYNADDAETSAVAAPVKEAPVKTLSADEEKMEKFYAQVGGKLLALVDYQGKDADVLKKMVSEYFRYSESPTAYDALVAIMDLSANKMRVTQGSFQQALKSKGITPPEKYKGWQDLFNKLRRAVNTPQYSYTEPQNTYTPSYTDTYADEYERVYTGGYDD